jgi:hypothetical protein
MSYKGGVAIIVGFTSLDVCGAADEIILANKTCVAHFKSAAVSLKIKYHARLHKFFMNSDEMHAWVKDCIFGLFNFSCNHCLYEYLYETVEILISLLAQ